jgi:bifunctional non-homologous end joining protein LigD
MLATPWREPFSDDAWLFEPKWDGYRVVVASDGDSITVRSRRGNDLTSRYPELVPPVRGLRAVIDAEVVVLEDGVPSFERLQQRNRWSETAAASHPVSCIAFDLLHLDDAPLLAESIESRQAALSGLGLADPFAVADPVVGSGLDLWEVVRARDLEGMVAKRLGSRYRPGVRSEDWRKIHNVNTVRAVVGGFTTGEGGRTGTFGSLVVGLWDGERLRWVGAVGTGFSDSDLRAIRTALDAQVRSDSPFHDEAEMPPGATWVEPSLVAAIGYRNWTTAGRLRHPRFKGFTDDPAAELTWEAEGASGAL